MPRKAKDLTGEKIGKLTIIRRYGKDRHGHPTWMTKCDCGKEMVVRGYSLINKKHPTKSCGCFASESKRLTKTTHGMTKTPEHRTWAAIKQRCTNPKVTGWKNYGGRTDAEITVCDRWAKSFEAFLEDMGPKPGADYSIERIDVNKGYSPENCKWILSKKQMSNTRRNRFISFDGETLHLSEWSRRTGIHGVTLLNRIKRGWSIRKTLTQPPKTHRLLEYQGEKLTMTEWSKRLSIPADVISQRLSRNWPLQKVFNQPVETHNRQLHEYNGEMKSTTAIAKEFGVDRGTLYRHLRKGLSLQEALAIIERNRPKRKFS